MLKRILILLAAGSVIGLLWITQTTTPASVHPLAVLFVFGMIYTLVLAVLTFFIFWGTRLAKRVVSTKSKPGYSGISLYRAYVYASVLAFAPVALLAMRSVGQQGVGDVLLVIIFEVLACFYVWRRS